MEVPVPRKLFLTWSNPSGVYLPPIWSVGPFVLGPADEIYISKLLSNIVEIFSMLQRSGVYGWDLMFRSRDRCRFFFSSQRWYLGLRCWNHKSWYWNLLFWNWGLEFSLFPRLAVFCSSPAILGSAWDIGNNVILRFGAGRVTIRTHFTYEFHLR